MKKINYSLFSVSTILALTTTQQLISEEHKHNDTKSLIETSFIFDGGYTIRSIDDEKYEGLYLDGFGHAHSETDEAEHDHEHSIRNRGFNLNYAEFGITSDVDPFWTLNSIFHLSENSFEIEELYVRSLRFPTGLELKLGKFYSSFGRLNSQHAHEWQFNDSPLIYSALFGSHNLLEKGVYLSYLLPVKFFTTINFEVLKGENEESLDKSELDLGNSGIIEQSDKPAIMISLKSSADFGKATFLGGVSYLNGISRINHLSETNAHAIDTTAKIIGLDLTMKYEFSSYSSLIWQSEYLSRSRSGDIFNQKADGNFSKNSAEFDQSGYYSQLFYKHDQNWGLGVRYSEISDNSKEVGGIKKTTRDDQKVMSAILQYSTSEFASFKLQFNSNRALNNSQSINDEFSEFIFSYNFAIGAHPAHEF